MVLGLRNLVFTEVKTFGQGDIVHRPREQLDLPASVVGLPMEKVPGFHPEHLQLDGGIEIGDVGARLSDIDYAGGVRPRCRRRIGHCE